MKTTLYAKDKKGSYKVWEAEAVDGKILVRHGKLGGKIQEKIFSAKPKNVGRSNATTAEQQAILETASRVQKQIDKGYRFTLEEADAASVQELLPMLASDYTKVGRSIHYPCFVSPKLDGVRCIARVIDGEVTFTSRGGKAYPVPKHIEEEVLWLYESTGFDCFDGELYIHGISLQNIVSAVKKPNELTPKLEFWIFDIPSDRPYFKRTDDLILCSIALRNKVTPIKMVMSEWAESEEHAREFMDYWLVEGFEGMMLRNRNGSYEWNHRSRNLQKWKDFQDAEYKVVDFEEDNIGEAVYWMQMLNGNRFKAKPRGNHEYRSIENAQSFMEKWVTVRYQQLTDDGVPQFPVIIGVRECTEEGCPID